MSLELSDGSRGRGEMGNHKIGLVFLEIGEHRGKKRSDRQKIGTSEFEMGNSGQRGSIRLEKLVCLLLSGTEWNS